MTVTKQPKNMKTIKVKVFKFSELGDEAKEKAREWYRRISEGDNYYAETVIDEAVEQAEHMGITIDTQRGTRSKPCIWWSGFWSQGDGACFDGEWRASDCHAEKVAKGWGESDDTTELKRIAAEFKRIADLYPQARFSVKQYGHYYHEYCTTFDFNWEDEATVHGVDDTGFDSAEEALKEAARDFMRWIYRRLEREYEYQNSDEAVDENISCNDYEFLEDGSRSKF